MFLVVAGPAGAASRNCTALTSLNNKLSSIDTSGKNFRASQFEDVGDEFHSAARKAKGKLKTALNNLGDVYETIGGGDISDLAELGSSKYGKAMKTFVKQSVTCA